MNLSIEKAGEKLNQKLGNTYTLVLLAIIVFSAAIRFKYAFFDGMWVDEANIARMAVDVSKHPLQYMTDWRGNLTKRLPVFIYSLVVSKTLLGGILGTETALRIVNPVIGSITVLGTYFLGREMYTRKAGIIAAALLAVNPLSWFLSERLLIGTSLTAVFLMVIGATYYAFEGRKYSRYAIWSIGPLIAVSLLTKQPAYALGLIVPTYFLYKKRESLYDYFMTDKSFNDSGLYALFTNRDYYVSAGLGIALMMPWMLRNMNVCGFPLCGILKSLSFASKDVTRTTASVQSSFYFIFALGMILTIPVLIFLILRALTTIYENLSSSADLLVKKLVFVISLSFMVFMIDQRFLPMFLLSSLSVFATEDSDKLLWLWTGIGIGIMSVPEIKVPRYVVFTIPAMVLLSSKSVLDISNFIAGNLPELEIMRKAEPENIILLLVVLPILVVPFNQGTSMVSTSGSPGLAEAGDWLANNMKDGESFASSSPQMKFYARPHVEKKSANRLPANSSEFKKFAAKENLTYLVVDIYERTQPDWLQLEVAPYRLPTKTVSQIRNGDLSPQEVGKKFRSKHDYLVPAARFGETSLPLVRSNQQPAVIIYRINYTAIR